MSKHTYILDWIGEEKHFLADNKILVLLGLHVLDGVQDELEHGGLVSLVGGRHLFDRLIRLYLDRVLIGRLGAGVL